MRPALLLPFALLLAACASNPHPGWSHYGLDVAPKSHQAATPIASLTGSEKGITLDGTIGEVCLMKGCWMTLSDGSGRTIFVRFRDYRFFVPRNAMGRRAVLFGDARDIEVPVDELRHLAEDAGRSPAEIAAITQPERRVEFLADDVWIEGEGLAEPHRQ